LTTITIDPRQHHSFLESAHWILKNSGYNIKYANTRMYTDWKKKFITAHKNGGLSFIFIDGKLIMLAYLYNKALIKLCSIDIIQKYKPSLIILFTSNIDQVQNALNIPVTNWIPFPCGCSDKNSSLAQKYQWQPSLNHKTGLLTSGRHSLRTKHRYKWFNHVAKNPNYIVRYNARLSNQQYIDFIKNTNWGLVINNEVDCREYEHISNHHPLAITYVPKYYHIPCNPYEHYYYLKTPEDLNKLPDVDPIPYYNASKYLWENYLRPDMATKLLINIVKKYT
jgi:hypothetical protein